MAKLPKQNTKARSRIERLRAFLLKPGNARTRDILLPEFWTFCPPNGTTDGYILQICWI